MAPLFSGQRLQGDVAPTSAGMAPPPPLCAARCCGLRSVRPLARALHVAMSPSLSLKEESSAYTQCARRVRCFFVMGEAVRPLPSPFLALFGFRCLLSSIPFIAFRKKRKNQVLLSDTVAVSVKLITCLFRLLLSVVIVFPSTWILKAFQLKLFSFFFFLLVLVANLAFLGGIGESRST